MYVSHQPYSLGGSWSQGQSLLVVSTWWFLLCWAKPLYTRPWANPGFLPHRSFTASPPSLSWWLNSGVRDLLVGRWHNWLDTSSVAVLMLSSLALVPRESLWLSVPWPALTSSFYSSRVGLFLIRFVRISCFLLIMLCHFFKKENYQWHLWVSRLCYVSYCLSSKNMLMMVAHIWCPSLSSSTDPYFPFIIFFWYWWYVCSRGRERRGGESLFEENLMFKDLNFQNTNRNDCEFYKTFMKCSAIMNSPRTLRHKIIYRSWAYT